MERPKDITVTQYDAKGHVSGTVEVSTYAVAKALTMEQFCGVLVDYLSGFKEFRAGVQTGKMLHYEHPTLQGQLIRFCLGVIVSFAEKEHFIDARNETPIAMAKKIKALLDSGELNMGYMI